MEPQPEPQPEREPERERERERESTLHPGGSESRAKITATVLTKNSAGRLADVLAALAWCDEVIVLDTGSTDDTLAIARRHANVAVHEWTGPFTGFGRARRHAVALARNDWILSIDSDEIVTGPLAAEISQLTLAPKTVYEIPFRNHFNDRVITTCGWSPDRHARLFDRAVTDFSESEVHEAVQTQGLTVRTLSQPVDHYSYESSDDFLRKMRSYGQLFAAQYAGRRKSGVGTAVWRGLWAFVKSYVLQRGMLQGYDGLLISTYKAQTTFWKYVLLHEANRRA